MTEEIKITAVYQEPVDVNRLIAALIQLAKEQAARRASAHEDEGRSASGDAA